MRVKKSPVGAGRTNDDNKTDGQFDYNRFSLRSQTNSPQLNYEHPGDIAWDLSEFYFDEATGHVRDTPGKLGYHFGRTLIAVAIEHHLAEGVRT